MRKCRLPVFILYFYWFRVKTPTHAGSPCTCQAVVAEVDPTTVSSEIGEMGDIMNGTPA